MEDLALSLPARPCEPAADVAHLLTWTWVHATWVGLSAAVLVAALLALIPADRVRLRYGVVFAGLLCPPAAAAATLLREWLGADHELWVLVSDAEGGFASLASGAGLALDGAWTFLDLARQRVSAWLAPFEGAIARAWGLLAAFAFLRLAAACWRSARLARIHEVRAAPAVQARVARLARELRAGSALSKVRLYWSSQAEVPQVCGVWRPRLVIPRRLRPAVERGVYDSVLLHELAHVRRHDTRARGLEALIEALLGLHPLAAWFTRRLARAREHCCDEVAVRHGAARLSYLRRLAALEQGRAAWRARRMHRAPAAAALALRATDGELIERVTRLSGIRESVRSPRRAAAIAAMLLGAAGLCLGAMPSRDLPTWTLSAAELTLPAELAIETRALRWVEGQPLDAEDLDAAEFDLRWRATAPVSRTGVFLAAPSERATGEFASEDVVVRRRAMEGDLVRSPGMRVLFARGEPASKDGAPVAGTARIEVHATRSRFAASPR